MFTVLIVDDELHALTGIQRAFPWETFGFSVVCATTDPTEAAKRLLNESIDLALVDVKMPEITGLDLIKLARTHSLSTEFILLSGYSEFDLVQSAIHYRVLDFCLKPVRVERAHEVLQETYRYLVKKKEGQSTKKLREIIDAPHSIEAWFAGFPGSYQCVVIRGMKSGECPSFFTATRIYRISEPGKVVFIAKSMEKITEGYFSPEGDERIGIGLPVGDLSEITTSIEQAHEALESCRLYPSTRVFLYSNPDASAIRLLLDQLRKENPEDLADDRFVFSLASTLRTLRFTPRMLDSLLDSLIAANKFALDSKIPEYRTIEEYCFHVIACLKETRDGNTDTKTVDDKVAAILEFARASMGTKITLAAAAKRFGLHPNYASELVKRKTGRTFTSFLQEIRMDEAKRLLDATDKSLEEIASEIGVDYFHFNKLFRKFHGIPPSQYRNRESRGS